MSNVKGRKKTRPKKHSLKRRSTRFLAVLAAAALVGIIAYSSLNPRKSLSIEPPSRIAIVDELSVQLPDTWFIQTIQGILNQTGLKVDYYPSEDVTVDFYRTLPSHNYKLIIFRVHSTAESEVENAPPWVALFTSEKYSITAHLQMQLDTQLVKVKFPNEETSYFGIIPPFIRNSMEGSFNDTTIISMGCDGLKLDTMAWAFTQKGVKAFISWDGFVSESQTDIATVYLLRHLITEKETIGEAVIQTMKDVGPDPTYKSELTFYPDSALNDTFLAEETVATPTVSAARKKT